MITLMVALNGDVAGVVSNNPTRKPGGGLARPNGRYGVIRCV